jgi:hypothetical protein
MRDIFAKLHVHGQQVAGYQQRSEVGRILDSTIPMAGGPSRYTQQDRADLSGGICCGATIEWIREKLGGTNSFFRRQSKNFVCTPTPAKSAIVTHKAAVHQLEHVRNDVPLDDLFRQNRFILTAMEDYHNKDKDEIHLPYTDIAQTFERVLAGLKKGECVLLRATVDSVDGRFLGYHAAALYKSHGGQAHFFDANVGAFEIRDSAAFIRAWVDCYPKKQQKVSMKNLDDGFYKCAPAREDDQPG